MEVNPNRSINNLNRALRKKKVASEAKDSESPSTEGVSEDNFSSSAGNVDEALKALPEERPDRIEDGRKLARDPNYPNRKELNELGLLVIRSELGDRHPDDV